MKKIIKALKMKYIIVFSVIAFGGSNMAIAAIVVARVTTVRFNFNRSPLPVKTQVNVHSFVTGYKPTTPV